MHKAGFVNIIGRPNVGKSTLINAMMGEKLSIVTSKAQTTRHRILGILNGKDFQVILSDTPGIVKPAYRLHESMMKHVRNSLNDADMLLLMTDIKEKAEAEGLTQTLKMIQNTNLQVLLLINKIDLLKNQKYLKQLIQSWEETFSNYKISNFEITAISALKSINTGKLLDTILMKLPESPSYYPKDTLTDKPEIFFVSEIIREKIFLHFKQEIPYSTEVRIEFFKEEAAIIKIHAFIIVSKQSQKPIIIGKKGAAIKRIGTEARQDIERFLGKKVYLELFVKVLKDWRDKPGALKEFGY